MVFCITRGIAVKPSLCSRKAPTAISFAALSTTGSVPPARSAAYAKPETRETVVRRIDEIEPAGARQVERWERSVPSFRVGACVLNGQPHVGHTELRDD